MAQADKGPTLTKICSYAWNVRNSNIRKSANDCVKKREKTKAFEDENGLSLLLSLWIELKAIPRGEPREYRN